MDALDNFYIADSSNSRIREVDATGDIDTVAGSGGFGYSGDGWLATFAVLNVPEGVAYDDTNTKLYISDTENHRVRVVDSFGDIYHFAGNGFEGSIGDGGQADSAIFYEPNGVAYSSTGILYIADLEGHQVRKVDTSTGIITTLAGTGVAGYSGDGGQAALAQLYQPTALALDEPASTLYIADSWNNRVRAVNLVSEIITTYAGTGTAGIWAEGVLATNANIDTPWGIALDASGNLYIAETLLHGIGKVDINTGNISTFAGNWIAGYSGDGGAATSAQILAPYGLWFDQSDNKLYIADTWNNVIRVVDASSGIINTVAGDKATRNAGYSGDGGSPTSAFLNAPEAVAVTDGGEIIISDTNNHAIRYINPFTGLINTIAGDGSPGAGPAGNGARRQAGAPGGDDPEARRTHDGLPVHGRGLEHQRQDLPCRRRTRVPCG
ncbi:hypothetical protein LCGC14_2280110 [marine sediment metagenome]|uniref:Teneurin NHL domain-containing protein n=1 Tax=marine sediment metagenome TaxID=412755 RepID=A0A0F9DGP2_9ZZZZ